MLPSKGQRPLEQATDVFPTHHLWGWGCFCFLAVVNSAAWHIYVQVLVWLYVLSLGVDTGVELLDHVVMWNGRPHKPTGLQLPGLPAFCAPEPMWQPRAQSEAR